MGQTVGGRGLGGLALSLGLGGGFDLSSGAIQYPGASLSHGFPERIEHGQIGGQPTIEQAKFRDDIGGRDFPKPLTRSVALPRVKLFSVFDPPTLRGQVKRDLDRSLFGEIGMSPVLLEERKPAGAGVEIEPDFPQTIQGAVTNDPGHGSFCV